MKAEKVLKLALKVIGYYHGRYDVCHDLDLDLEFMDIIDKVEMIKLSTLTCEYDNDDNPLINKNILLEHLNYGEHFVDHSAAVSSSEALIKELLKNEDLLNMDVDTYEILKKEEESIRKNL